MHFSQTRQERIAVQKFKKLLAKSETPGQLTKAFQYGIAVGSARAEQRHGQK